MIRSEDDGQFRGAFLELYLHEFLIRTGHHVTVHPGSPSTNRKPDFFVERDGSSYFLEAIAPDVTPAQKASAARQASLLDALDGVGDHRFFLDLEDMKVGSSMPRAAHARLAIGRWLEGLDPDDPSHVPASIPFTWTSGDWSVTVSAMPIPAAKRGPVSRSIGIYSHEPVKMIDDAPTILRALAAKDRAYGPLEFPFVVAVGVSLFDNDDWDSSNAFFGREILRVSRADPSVATRLRQSDGYFGWPGHWKHQNVSAVLMVNQLQPARFLNADVVLWRHPSPRSALPREIRLPGASVELETDHLKRSESSLDLWNVFGISNPWPVGEPFPRSE